MHPMFVKLFLEADADDLPAEEEERRRRRAGRRRPVMVTRAAARGRDGGPRPLT